MQKQSLTQTCLCGQAITFPEGEIKFKCKCHAIWEIDSGGYWFTNLTIKFIPAKVRGKNHYDKRMKNRRKAGKKNAKTNSEVTYESAQYQRARLGL